MGEVQMLCANHLSPIFGVVHYCGKGIKNYNWRNIIDTCAINHPKKKMDTTILLMTKELYELTSQVK